ncbi:MAG: hypothetical protein ACYCPO_00715 [Acidobacteriaceae bacterium]
MKGEDRAFGPAFVVWNSAEGFGWLKQTGPMRQVKLRGYTTWTGCSFSVARRTMKIYGSCVPPASIMPRRNHAPCPPSCRAEETDMADATGIPSCVSEADATMAPMKPLRLSVIFSVLQLSDVFELCDILRVISI